MTRRRKILLLALCGLIAVVAVCFFCLREREPSYNGKKLSEWLDDYASYRGSLNYTNAEVRELTNAITRLGTNHAPLLASWFLSGNSIQRYIQKSDRHPLLRKLVAPIRSRVETKRRRGSCGLWVLGTNGIGALPVLKDGFNATSDPRLIYPCASAISQLGAPGIDFLIHAVQKGGTNEHRRIAMQVLFNMAYLETNTTPAARALLDVARDKNDGFRTGALMCVAALPGCTDAVVPIITNSLLSTNIDEQRTGFQATQAMNKRATRIIPTLRLLSNGTNARVRAAAIDSIARIESQASDRN